MSTHLNMFPAASAQAKPASGRRHPRLNVDISVRVFRNGSFATLGRGHDLSCSGMALYTPVELEADQEIQLSFVLPYSRVQFGVRAFVRNRDGFRYGIEFTRLSRQESAEIERVTNILDMT